MCMTATDLELEREDAPRLAAENVDSHRQDERERQRQRAGAEVAAEVAEAKAERANWSARIGAAAHLDSLPEARKDFLVSVLQKMAAANPDGAELLQGAARMIHPVDPAAANVDEPIPLIPQLPPDVQRAASDADAAGLRVEDKIEALFRHRVSRAPNCGKGATLHVRRDRRGGKGVEDALVRTSCGRSDCPHCWRKRLAKTYRRAARRLLDAPPEADEPGKPGRKNLPRTEHVHAGEIDWWSWETFDKGLRRLHRGHCGRLRVRRSDNTVLVICAEPFPGSRRLTAAEATDLASAAIDEMHTARHAFRLLGDWNDAGEHEWRLVERHAEPINFLAVREELAALEVKAHFFKSPDLAMLLWRAESEIHADTIASAALSAAGCPTLAKEENRSSPGINPDSATNHVPEEWERPDDTQPGEAQWT